MATPVEIKPEQGTRLAQLVEIYEQVKAQAASAKAGIDALNEAIKGELAMLAPEAQAVLVLSDALSKPLLMSSRNKTFFDAKRLEAEQPLLYAAYQQLQVQYEGKTPYWELRAVKGE